MKLTTLRPRLTPIRTDRVAVMQPGSWRTDKDSSTARGYGYRWQKARIRHLGAHPLCVMCEREGKIKPATVVDHRIPHRGDQTLFWDESNWQSLCATHHSSDKQREERANG